MPKYLVRATYSAEGLQGLKKDKASGRLKAVKQTIARLKGKIDAFYFCFGDSDVIIIADMPDNVSAAAISIATSATGFVRTSTTPLLTPDEVDKALELEPGYRPPGGAS